MNRKNEPLIIIAEKHIKMPIKCTNSDCKKWMKGAIIKNVEVKCSHCSNTSIIDISEEYAEEYNKETLKTTLFLIFKELREHEEMVIQYHIKHKDKVKWLLEGLQYIMIESKEMKSTREKHVYDNKPKWVEFKRVKIFKTDILKYQTEHL